MKLIAAVDNNWAIGYKNDLLVSIPADKRFFRQQTTGKVVIMGRRTLESLPNALPLKERDNIVITSKTDYKVKDAVVVHSVEEALDAVKGYDSDDVYVIGGASVYEQMLKYCDTALITKIDYEYVADAYIENLDRSPEWELVDESDEQTCYDMIFTFCTYKRK